MNEHSPVKCTILVVDDNPDDIEIARIALESISNGIRLQKAFDGETALHMLEEGRCQPDMVLLDLKMPGMSGIEVLRRLRANDKFKKLPVFMSSSSILDSDAVESMAAGANSFIGKSFDLQAFTKELQAVLQDWCKHNANTE